MTHHPSKNAWISGVAAYTLWGAMPLYWRMFQGTPAFLIFLQRCLWSFPFLLLLSLLRRDPEREVWALDRNRLPWLSISGILIGANWWIYIYGVNAHRVLEMSLGYFLAPLLSAALGVVFLRERLTWGQWAGVLLVVMGVLLYGTQMGGIPLLAIGLAATFAFYGLVRKVVKVPPMTALTTEAMVLFVLAAIYVATTPKDPLMSEAWALHAPWLVLGGTLTALPLLWYAVAVRGMTLTTLGMLNYISPTGKFLIAVFVFGEVVTQWDLYSFGLIWTGIVLYLAFTFKRQRMPLTPE